MREVLDLSRREPDALARVVSEARESDPLPAPSGDDLAREGSQRTTQWSAAACKRKEKLSAIGALSASTVTNGGERGESHGLAPTGPDLARRNAAYTKKRRKSTDFSSAAQVGRDLFELRERAAQILANVACDHAEAAARCGGSDFSALDEGSRKWSSGRVLDGRASHHGAQRNWLLACLLLGTIASAARASASGEPCAAPAVTSDGWEVATPHAAGFDASALCAALTAVARGDANLHSVIVERRGRLVAELYRAGPDTPIDDLYGLGNPLSRDVSFSVDTLHDTRSVSKSVVALLVGIAQHDGRIPSLGSSVLSLFPELADLRTPERDAITLEQLLTGAAGSRGTSGMQARSRATRRGSSGSRISFVFDRPLAAPPGTRFNYNGGGTATLAELLTRGGGKPLLEQVREELFEPLGITHWEWALDLRDRPLAFAGLRLRPRDMAKLGRLVLEGGRWRGRQLVPEAWVAASLRKQIATELRMPPDVEGGLGYGYQWWTGNTTWRSRPVSWSAALGNGGQRIFVVPELDLTVVTTAGD